MKYYILLVLTTITMGVVSAQQKNIDTITKIKVEEKVKLPFGELNQDKLVGAVDVIKADALSHTSDYNVESALAGQAPGLIISKGNGAPGFDTTWMKVRGLSRGGNSDSPLIVIDGIANRSLSSIALDEVESIQVLKDVTAKMLYGSKAANGVLMVTTKRGYNGTKKVSFFVESGFKSATVLPEYLNSADYATLYNQARINDGLDPVYTDQQISDYRNNPSPLNPDVDYNSEFLKNNASFTRFNAELIGGDDKTKYFLNLGYIREDGLEKLRSQDFNRLNIRSNLDYQVNKSVSMFLDIAGRMDIWDRANINNNEFFNSLSSHRPNDYALYVGDYGDTDNLGWSPRVATNLVGELTRSGYVKTNNYYAQTNLGLNIDLSSITSGLSIGGYVTFDFYNNVGLGKSLQYSRVDPITETRIGTDVLTGSESRMGDDTRQNLGIVGTLDYNKSWGKNDLQINFSALQQTLIRKSTLDGPTTQQDDKNMNFGGRVNYTFNNKYTVEGTASYMGSDKFTKANRWGLFGAGGLGWIISNENFLKNSSAVNFLKLKGSFGVMGYDNSFDYLLYRDFYVANGNLRTGPKNAVQEFGWRAGQIGNTNLTFEKSREFNIGVEASLFNNKVAIEANYFNEYRYDMPAVLNNALPDFTGELKPIGNFNEVSNTGVDFFVRYKEHIGDFNFSIGTNVIFSKAVNEVFDELNEYAHLNRTGQATDAIFGWQADGLYQNEAEIIADNVTSSYGEIIPGDVRLLNIVNDKGDNVIDQFDRKIIGNSFPRTHYALNLDLEYKGFQLFVIGQGVSGVDRFLNTSYYWNVGENKYSNYASGAAVPGSVAGASSPRLTSLSQSHSYRNSSYWLTNGAFFKIRTMELSYNFDENVSSKIGANNLKLFVRGNDLITISDIKDSDPENMNAGINAYPMYKTISLGLKLTY
ncbi:SusC/RagA family TonB-linked outer membrane protein [Tamlana fucoidanivorans]|uniref:SusC/RagA family TonB-linked outer membrane protein n=1 Tax=Allotamlana fucoidanivorans TaxID=2583814 RepID=A0A5C4SLW8_9FLAO|nr:SusC/RagA family TonB-linked outer membrane protein [Tamlana fucoidanivorans]TNJ44669.1 SusC/RagA family TonB-linked outer membrane protein [Tamlana fucoidanivorans]